MEEFDVSKAGKAQKELQTAKGYPDFAPRSGICYICKKNIYDEIAHHGMYKTYKTGISVERASSELITGCPHCNRSYCD